VFKIYYEHGRTRSKGPFSSVKLCTNRFFQTLVNYGKSPCFLRCAFSSVVDVDCLCLSFEVMLGCGFLWILEGFREFKGFDSENED
jgi:hypothetical protein